ncbi:Capsule polysaccharide biosynthesis protein [Legionella busanensis]|uniref:Capsule polysaccharide biosynthesis protein n=1 Tax=Legionella busanensis TaxID=190655 RepID=A0A378JUI7_9GAMM|nr:hypothetical protein [Legionella busanensis]STX51872.1 Capsule polysaccharide biosynthesis protein [Legionella busanensis]
MLIKKLLKGINGLPIIKYYGQLIRFLHRQIKIYLISQSNLIHKKPNERYIELCQSQPSYLYLPWIEALTNRLIIYLDNSATHFQLIPLPIFSNTKTIKSRNKINFFTEHCHHQLNDILFNWLKPIADHVKGIIFTFDYGLLQRQIIKVCQQLKIQTILIPHESVFFNRDKYYFHPLTKINTPLCDYVLCWGQLQKDIFTSRGYPEKRIQVVGAPKLDRYYDYQPKFSHNEFCERAALNKNKPIILFAAQSLDFQVNHQIAIQAQQIIITQLMSYCQQNNYEFILRCPPTGCIIGDKGLFNQMQEANFFIDSPSPAYCFDPEETIYHADVIVSINSTMLFEALLMGKRSLSVKYFDFKEDWQRAGIKCVFNEQELKTVLNNWLQDKQFTKPTPTKWAIQSFSLNGFDGQATTRINQCLEKIVKQPLSQVPPPFTRVFFNEGPPIDFIYFSKEGSQFDYIAKLLNAKTIISPKRQKFIFWAELHCLLKEKQRVLASQATKYLPKVYLEQGIIHFGSKWTSITIDDKEVYDANNCLETLLNSDIELTFQQENEAMECINRIVSNHFFSAFKNANKSNVVTLTNRPKFLLIDEYREAKNKTKEASFKKLLDQVALECKHGDILIYSPNRGHRKKTYLNQASLKPYLKQYKNIHFVTPDYDLYFLLTQVEKVYVVSSIIGFFALMIKKKVYCYGLPFYANWGLTIDDIQIPKQRKRTIVELFYFACMHLSRYYSPLLGRRCSLNEYIDYILDSKENDSRHIF